MTKYDGKCLHGAGPGEPGDCEEERQDGSCLCADHTRAVLEGWEKPPPLRMNFDYVSKSRKVFLVQDIPGLLIIDTGETKP